MRTDIDAIIGSVVVAGALGFVTFLILWSRRYIERIARSGFGSAREIRKKLHGDR